MKNLIYLFIGIFLLAVMPKTYAQKVYENDVSMSLGVQNALYVDIEGANKKMAEKLWKEYIKDYGKTKYNKKAKEYATLVARVPSVSTSQDIDVYTKFEEMGSMARAYFWFDMSDGFFNTVDYNDKAEGAEMFIQEYALTVRKEVIRDELKEQEKVLGKLNKEFEKLQKNNQKYHDDIEDARKKIADKEREIEKNIGEQESKQIEIGAQQNVIEEIIGRLNNLRKT